MFLMTAALLMVINLFHSGLRHGAQARMVVEANRLAENTLAEIRAWAREPANFLSGWTPYNGVVLSDPDWPAFRIRVDCEPTGIEVLSPSTALETAYSPDQRRLSSSVVPVEVTVEWGAPGDPHRSVTVVTQVGEPLRQLGPNPLQVTRSGGASDPVPQEGLVSFQAQLVDSSGQPIQDISFEWYAVPVTGNATVVPLGSRNRASSQLQHHYYLNPITSTWSYEPGQVRARARAIYGGRELEQESLDVVLSP